MIEFWIGVAILTLIAIGFVCWPLMLAKKSADNARLQSRKAQNVESFRQRLTELEEERNAGLLSEENLSVLSLELEKNLLIDADTQEGIDVPIKINTAKVALVAVIGLLVISVSLAFYSRYGSYNELQWFSDQHQNQSGQPGAQPTAAQAIAMLQKELAQNPDNAEGWYILASAYIGTNQFAKASVAFEQVLALLPDNAPQIPTVTGQYAQSLYFIDGQVTDKVKVQINKALQLDANEVVSLGLLGIDAYEREDYQKAIDFWTKAKGLADISAASSLDSGIAKARAKLGLDSSDRDTNASQNAVVRVTLDISPQVRAQVNAQDTVFVFARPIGGGIPLAAVKLSVAELPKTLVLDDSLAMMPQGKISLQKNVEVSARISLSGRPQAEKGDFTAAVVSVAVSGDKESVNLLIDKLVE